MKITSGDLILVNGHVVKSGEMDGVFHDLLDHRGRIKSTIGPKKELFNDDLGSGAGSSDIAVPEISNYLGTGSSKDSDASSIESNNVSVQNVGLEEVSSSGGFLSEEDLKNLGNDKGLRIGMKIKNVVLVYRGNSKIGSVQEFATDVLLNPSKLMNACKSCIFQFMYPNKIRVEGPDHELNFVKKYLDISVGQNNYELTGETKDNSSERDYSDMPCCDMQVDNTCNELQIGKKAFKWMGVGLSKPGVGVKKVANTDIYQPNMFYNDPGYKEYFAKRLSEARKNPNFMGDHDAAVMWSFEKAVANEWGHKKNKEMELAYQKEKVEDIPVEFNDEYSVKEIEPFDEESLKF